MVLKEELQRLEKELKVAAAKQWEAEKMAAKANFLAEEQQSKAQVSRTLCRGAEAYLSYAGKLAEASAEDHQSRNCVTHREQMWNCERS